MVNNIPYLLFERKLCMIIIDILIYIIIYYLNFVFQMLYNLYIKISNKHEKWITQLDPIQYTLHLSSNNLLYFYDLLKKNVLHIITYKFIFDVSAYIL